MLVKVKDGMIGYYGHLRRYGVGAKDRKAADVFEIEPKAFSSKWMVKVGNEEVEMSGEGEDPAEKRGRGRPKKDEVVATAYTT